MTTSIAVGAAATEAAPAVSRTSGKLGLGLLVALVVGSILGSGIFGLPQNMAAGAGAGAGSGRVGEATSACWRGARRSKRPNSSSPESLVGRSIVTSSTIWSKRPCLAARVCSIRSSIVPSLV